jgi:putative pyruvate formate lyase activating enzyme
VKNSAANIGRLQEIIRRCALCPRRCGVDRSAGPVGTCGIGAEAVVASAGPDFGEEPVLVGKGGSGTIFFSGCSLDCVFCQNDDISHGVSGRKASPAQIAAMALRLAGTGCVNINFVTPTHVAHAVAQAIALIREGGCTVPVVYNCGGYEPVDVLRLLDGLVEIFMPDFKWADADAGKKYSGVSDYPVVATASLAEMYRQVGTLKTNSNGVATVGMLVRHLVMPGDLAHSRDVIDTVARIAPGCAINVMGQYHPAYRAGEFPELMAPVPLRTIEELREYAASRGLVRVD